VGVTSGVEKVVGVEVGGNQTIVGVGVEVGGSGVLESSRGRGVGAAMQAHSPNTASSKTNIIIAHLIIPLGVTAGITFPLSI